MIILVYDCMTVAMEPASRVFVNDRITMTNDRQLGDLLTWIENMRTEITTIVDMTGSIDIGIHVCYHKNLDGSN